MKTSSLILCSDPAKIHRIRVTCRCGVPAVHEYPSEITGTGIICLLSCASCGQGYRLCDGEITRIERGSPLDAGVKLARKIAPIIAEENYPQDAAQGADYDVNIKPRDANAWKVEPSEAKN